MSETALAPAAASSRSLVAASRPRRLADWRLKIKQNFGLAIAVILFCIVYFLYHLAHPKGFSSQVLVQNSNEVFTLAMLAMAQTVPVLMAGLDLSVGAVMTLVDCAASHLLQGSPIDIARGVAECALIGAMAGFFNGCVVVYGRIQPIIATLATGAIYIGIALFLRPTGGQIRR